MKALIIFLIFFNIAISNDRIVELPIGLTQDERSRIHEIYSMGRDTDPPPFPVRNVAEYERMQGVLIRYPFGISTDLILEMSENVTIYCLVSSNQQSSASNSLENGGIDLDNVEFVIGSTDSYWTRDYGPWWVVGGDRNMEQTNLVVTADGKTWDEVTRDTSYIGKAKLQATRDGGDLASSEENFITDLVRGNVNSHIPLIQKDFALAYREFYCLVDGQYEIQLSTYQAITDASYCPLYINGTQIGYMHIEGDGTGSRMQMTQRLHLKRGDRLQTQGRWSENLKDNFFQIVSFCNKWFYLSFFNISN